MSSLATINLLDTISIKNGSTTITKIMKGSGQIWPIFPFILFKDNTYYKVFSINGTEYNKEVFSTAIECPLVTTHSRYRLDNIIDSEPWMRIESVICNATDMICGWRGGYDNKTDVELFWTAGSLYFDYMSGNASGSFNRLYYSYSNFNTDAYTSKYKVIAGASRTNQSKINGTKFLSVYDYDTGTQLKNSTKSCYHTTETANAGFIFGPSNGTKRLTMYYTKITNESGDVIAFVHWKNDNGTYKLFDEVNQKYFYIMNDNTSTYPDEVRTGYSISISDNTPSEYYTVDGTITDSSGTYEKLVNNKTGISIKGIKIES